MTSRLPDLLERFKMIAEDEPVPRPAARFDTYAISNFRGGIGKSTLAFNLAWEISRRDKSLLLDLCPQCNFTQSLIGEDADRAAIWPTTDLTVGFVAC
jgi:chromosome partitioning protein